MTHRTMVRASRFCAVAAVAKAGGCHARRGRLAQAGLFVANLKRCGHAPRPHKDRGDVIPQNVKQDPESATGANQVATGVTTHGRQDRPKPAVENDQYDGERPREAKQPRQPRRALETPPKRDGDRRAQGNVAAVLGGRRHRGSRERTGGTRWAAERHGATHTRLWLRTVTSCQQQGSARIMYCRRGRQHKKTHKKELKQKRHMNSVDGTTTPNITMRELLVNSRKFVSSLAPLHFCLFCHRSLKFCSPPLHQRGGTIHTVGLFFGHS